MMEEELRCPSCKQLFVNPVLLPCYHAICLGCALEIQTACAASTSMPNGAAASSVSGSCTNVNTLQHSFNAIHINAPLNSSQTLSTRHSSHSSASSTTSSATGSESISSEQDQADKLSILSECECE